VSRKKRKFIYYLSFYVFLTTAISSSFYVDVNNRYGKDPDWSHTN